MSQFKPGDLVGFLGSSKVAWVREISRKDNTITIQNPDGTIETISVDSSYIYKKSKHPPGVNARYADHKEHTIECIDEVTPGGQLYCKVKGTLLHMGRGKVSEVVSPHGTHYLVNPVHDRDRRKRKAKPEASASSIPEGKDTAKQLDEAIAASREAIKAYDKNPTEDTLRAMKEAQAAVYKARDAHFFISGL